MKQLIILLLLIIACTIGYGKYKQYKRYNSPNVDYKTTKKIDTEYHNQEVVLNYYKAIENTNSFIKMEWTANDIDVRSPEDDSEKTKLAVKNYAEKLATIKYYESKLEKSFLLKAKGLSNEEIQFLEKTGTSYKAYQESLVNTKIKSMFNANIKMNYGHKNALIFEIQKQLNKKGFEVSLDGAYKTETLNAIKTFEEKNNLFADGVLDVLTIDALFE
ncbi:peptidoglycan-binding protein [Polaribacter sp. Z014]|uniref:peptidoglycan-binding domain-containing protein n=1 Tax=unclassified Polaribacter TaxID=196858 RepID=UPI00193BEF04|nr:MULTISPECIES: peptidoglycan-binding domain-containing protein [unclassified Polaribacter]MCL7763573.1 peptidoglycan-binding protein [Polaribacter sp. Z014]QVY66656.1 peptidoglycan-binding protein [Polaribacter sp. Q13]